MLRHGELVLAQTALICDYVGRRHGLAPRDAAGALHALELQLTIADLVVEVHDTHHPISAALYYEDQLWAAVKTVHDVRVYVNEFVNFGAAWKS